MSPYAPTWTPYRPYKQAPRGSGAYRGMPTHNNCGIGHAIKMEAFRGADGGPKGEQGVRSRCQGVHTRGLAGTLEHKC